VAEKLTLDAMIKRADFFQKSAGEDVGFATSTKQIPSLNFDNLRSDSNFVMSLRKPEFQRETNQWSVDQTLGFIQSFVEGYFVPSVILWQSTDGFAFVIDGAHRLSALRAWMEDDYGDRAISQTFFGGEISNSQKKIAKKLREKISTTVGTYHSLKDKLTARHANPAIRYDDLVNVRLKNVSSRALELQWVEGDANVAEASFFKINTQGTALDKTEEALLRNRDRSIAVAARSIVRAGTGHKYWSKFGADKVTQIERLSKEIHHLYFRPEVDLPLKTLQVPLGGVTSTLDSVATIIKLLSITESKVGSGRIQLEGSSEDNQGDATILVLKNCLKILNRMTGNESSSLGLHHAVYFYSERGKQIPELFLGMASLIKSKLLNNDNNFFKKFTSVRRSLEDYLLEHKQVITQALSAVHSVNRTDRMSDVFSYLIGTFADNGTPTLEGLFEAAKLKGTVVQFQQKVESKTFSEESKSKIFLREKFKTMMSCPICKGYFEPSISTSYDHIIRKSEGGTGEHTNGQMVHPFCNTGMKN
jgi:hypothetical protein